MKSGVNYLPHVEPCTILRSLLNLAQEISTDVFPPGQLANGDYDEGIKSLDDPVTAVDSFVTAVEQGMRYIGRYQIVLDSLAVNIFVMHKRDIEK